MKLLLDTQAFLWFIWNDRRLTAVARNTIGDPYNQRRISIASIWEIAIKVSIGKLTIAQPLGVFVPNQLMYNDIEVLPIGLHHLTSVSTLPYIHRDPFDRLIASQCLVEEIALVSSDPIFDKYGVTRIWDAV